MFHKRIVLYGAPLAGKTTVIEAVSRRQGRGLKSIRVPSNHPSFDVAPHVGVSAMYGHDESTYELVTLPGGVVGEAPWLSLLRDASGIVVVLDCQAEVDELVRVVRGADALLPTPTLGCVVLSKADLVAPRVVERKRASLEDRLQRSGIGWPMFVTRADRPEVALEPIDSLVVRLCAGTS